MNFQSHNHDRRQGVWIGPKTQTSFCNYSGDCTSSMKKEKNQENFPGSATGAQTRVVCKTKCAQS